MAEIERRPIKFRAWDRTKNRWFYPPGMMDSHPGDFSMTGDGRVYIEGVYQDVALCQFTGLTDNNGTEIYEEDIIADAGGWSYHVRWNDGAFVRDRSAQLQGMRELHGWERLHQAGTTMMEVIGNIFQNGDLINAKA